MADSTRIKELSLEVKRIAEQLEKNHAEAHSEIKRLEVDNGLRFEKVEKAIASRNEVLQEILTAMKRRKAEEEEEEIDASESLDVVASESYIDEMTTTLLQEDLDASEMMNANLPVSNASNNFFPCIEQKSSWIGVLEDEILDPPKLQNVQSDELPEDTIVDATGSDRGLYLKFAMPLDLNISSLFLSQARIRQRNFRLCSDAFFDECKVVPVSVYANLEVDTTGLHQDPRFVPPKILLICCAIENLGKFDTTHTTCLEKSMYELFNHSPSYVHNIAYADEHEVFLFNLPQQLVLKLVENCVGAYNRYLRKGEKVNQVQVHVNPCVGEQIGFINWGSIKCDLLDNVQDPDKPPYEKNNESNDKLIYSLSVQSNEVRMHYLKFFFEGFKCPILVFQEMSLRISKALQKIDHYTLSSILNGCIVLSAYIRYVHCWIIKTEFEISKLVSNTTATMDAKCDYLNAIVAMFSMQVWDTSTWPPLVVYAHHGKAVDSFRFYDAEVFKYRWSACQWHSTNFQKDAQTIFTWQGRVLLETDILIASTVVNVTQLAVVGEEENVAGWLPFTFSSKRDMIDIDSCKVYQIALDKPGGKSVLLGLLGLLVQATIDGVAIYSTNEWVFHASLYGSHGRDALEFIYATLRDTLVCSVNMLYLVMAPYSITDFVNWDLLESFCLSRCPRYQLNQRIFVPPKWLRRKSKDILDCIGQYEPSIEDKLSNIGTATLSILILWLDCVQLLLAIPCACLASHYVIVKIVERQSILNVDTTCKLTMFQYDPIGLRLVACNIRLQSAYGLDVGQLLSNKPRAIYFVDFAYPKFWSPDGNVFHDPMIINGAVDDLQKVIMIHSYSLLMGFIRAGTVDGKELPSYEFVSILGVVLVMQLFDLRRWISGCIIYGVMMFKKRGILMSLRMEDMIQFSSCMKSFDHAVKEIVGSNYFTATFVVDAAAAYMDDRLHTNSLYEDAIGSISSNFDVKKLSPWNQKIKEYGAHDYFPTSDVQHFAGIGMTNSEYNDYNAVEWNVDCVWKISWNISFTQRPTSSHDQSLPIKQWDPGGSSPISWDGPLSSRLIGKFLLSFNTVILASTLRTRLF